MPKKDDKQNDELQKKLEEIVQQKSDQENADQTQP